MSPIHGAKIHNLEGSIYYFQLSRYVGTIELNLYNTVGSKLKIYTMNRKGFIALMTVILPASKLLYSKSSSRRPKADGFVVKSGQARLGKSYLMKGVTKNKLDLKISGDDSEKDVAVFEQTGKTAKGGPPLHIHLHQDEWFYVVEGDYKFQVGEDIHFLRAGDTIFLPRKLAHAFVQLSDTGKMVVTYMPAGKMEAFFALTDSWSTPPSKEEVDLAFENHGMKVVGLPLSVDE